MTALYRSHAMEQLLTLRVPDALMESLEAVAAAEDRSKSYIVREALAAYLKLYAAIHESRQKKARSGELRDTTPKP